jgi:hypothetical protein
MTHQTLGIIITLEEIRKIRESYLHLSIYLSIYDPADCGHHHCEEIRKIRELSIYLTTYLPIYLFIYLSIYLSINQSINQSIIHPSVVAIASKQAKGIDLPPDISLTELPQRSWALTGAPWASRNEAAWRQL